MSRRSTVILLGLILLVAAGAAAIRFWPTPPPPPAEEPAKPAPVAEKKPAFVDLSPEEARQLVAGQAVIGVPEGRGRLPAAGQYGVLVGGLIDGMALESLLGRIYDRNVAAVALVGRLQRADGQRLPAVPLLILAAEPTEGGNRPAWRRVFATGEPGTALTPPFAADGALPVTLSLDVHFFDSGDPAFVGGLVGEAESLLSSMAGPLPPLWRKDGPVSGSSADFARRLEARAAKTVEGLLRLELDARTPAREIAFSDAGDAPPARVLLALDTRPPRLAAEGRYIDFASLDAAPIDARLTVGGLLRQDEAVLARALTDDGDGLLAACTALRDTLEQAAGLTPLDTAAALLALRAPRALFREAPAFRQTCLGDQAPALERLGMLAGPPETPPLSPGLLDRANRVLGEIGALLRFGPDKGRTARIAGHMADAVTVVDRSGLWLPHGGGAPFHGAGAAVDPAAGPLAVADYLASLPAVHFACYSTGEGRHGIHRASLLQLQHDPSLWVLDAAFDARGRVIGLELAPAGREQVCRAVGQRKSGPGACYFATTGRSYAGIDPGKC